MNQQGPNFADCLLTFPSPWPIYSNKGKVVGGMLFRIVFNSVDVCSQAGLLMPSNCLSEENMLTFATYSQSTASL